MMITGTTVLQVKVLDTPSASGRQIGLISAGVTFVVTTQSREWLTRAEGGFVNVMKGDAIAVIVRTEIITPPVDPPSVTVTHTVNVDSTGKISVDGGAYA